MEVQCVFKPLLVYEGSARYTCKVSSISITNQFTRIRSFKGIHEEGKSNDDVQAVQFASTRVDFLPWRLTSVFPQLKHLTIIDCGLKSITRKDLIGLENLISLDLGNNQLTTIPNDLFVNMSGLKQLCLFNNKLERMSAAFLLPVKAQLEWLSLQENPKLSVFFQSTSLDVGQTKTSSVSVDEIMKLIELVCSRPEIADLPDLSEPFANESMRKFKKLRTSGQLSDFSIAVGSKIFPVHKNILAINSSVFTTMFTSQPKEQLTNRIKITNFSEAAVSDFLSYIYTGDTPEEINALEVYGLSEVFDVRKLKLISEDMILRNINKENALTVLEFGILQNLTDIAEIAFDEMKLVFPEHRLPEHLKTCLQCVRKFIVENETCAAANRRFDSFLKSLSEDIKSKCDPIKEEKASNY